MKNMKLLIDTNILLDVLQDRAPFADASSQVWKLCEAGIVTGYVSALSIANIVYIMRKVLTAETTASIVEELSLVFEFSDLCASDILHAAKCGWADYEDALQFVTAGRLQADAIITRNVKDYAQGDIPVWTPADFIKMNQEEGAS